MSSKSRKRRSSWSKFSICKTAEAAWISSIKGLDIKDSAVGKFRFGWFEREEEEALEEASGIADVGGAGEDSGDSEAEGAYSESAGEGAFRFGWTRVGDGTEAVPEGAEVPATTDEERLAPLDDFGVGLEDGPAVVVDGLVVSVSESKDRVGETAGTRGSGAVVGPC